MNYVVEHSDLRKHLDVWARGRRVIIIKIFFWRAGSIAQRSINGLLRSLLYQLVTGIPILCSSILTLNEVLPTWTDKSLQQALTAFMGAKQADTVVCLFLDGLDEFEGDEDSKSTLINIIKDLSVIPGVKAVISSRPEPFLEDNFSQYNSLRLQDLTHEDFFTYTKGKLLSEVRIKLHKELYHKEINQLIKDVCRKADGVFLWVRLATQDLIAGIRARDSIPMLQERLKQLNNSLEGLFTQMIQKIHPTHRALAAEYVKLLLRWNEMPISRGVYPCRGDLTLFHVAFALHPEVCQKMHDLMTTGSLEERGSTQCLALIEDIKLQVVARTGGLLDIFEQKHGLNDDGTHKELPCVSVHGKESHSSIRHFVDTCYHLHHYTSVQLIHRSVLDFLSGNESGLRLMSESAISTDDLDDVILRACQGTARSILFIFYEARYWRRLDMHPREAPVFQERLVCDLRATLSILWVKFRASDLKSCISSYHEINSWYSQSCRKIFPAMEAEAVQDSTSYLEVTDLTSFNHCLLIHVFKIEALSWFWQIIRDEYAGPLQRLYVIVVEFSDFGDTDHTCPDESKTIMFHTIIEGLIRKGLDPNAGCKFWRKPVYMQGNWQWYRPSFLICSFFENYE